ncbi:MAG: hypothetical protein KGS72_05065 [Cyanobacteria bacterium REEB67]|nr:hypothetical protein [Cyanobacteria bacterium REEB67]
MTIETARKIVLGLKLGFAAVWGYLLFGSVAGAGVAVVFAYVLLQCYPRPFTTFKESLRVNWRSFALLGVVAAAAILALAFHIAAAMVLVKGFQTGFLGLVCGELFQAIILDFARKPDDSSK